MSKINVEEVVEKISNLRNTILEWDATLQNNPSFDDVCDYLESVFQSVGEEFNYEEQKDFLNLVCKHYISKK
jgi:hypothetical protein